MVDFTDEEGYGKYLDLHESYVKYVNLKGIQVSILIKTRNKWKKLTRLYFLQKIDYISYLNIFDRLFDIPREKKNAEYRNYLQGLVDYLVDYVARVKPVMDLDNLFQEIEQDFEKDFVAGTFPGWPVSFWMSIFYTTQLTLANL